MQLEKVNGEALSGDTGSSYQERAESHRTHPRQAGTRGEELIGDATRSYFLFNMSGRLNLDLNLTGTSALIYLGTLFSQFPQNSSGMFDR